MDFSEDLEVTIQKALQRLKSENRVASGDQIVMVTNVLHGKVVESIQLREVEDRTSVYFWDFKNRIVPRITRM